jgi:hypothetical protein
VRHGWIFTDRARFPAAGYPQNVLRHPAALLAVVAVALLAPVGARAGSLGLAHDAGFQVAGAAAWTAADQLGVGVVRIDVDWPAVAPTAPASPRQPGSRGYAWDAIDARVRDAAANGRAVLLAVRGTPDWARAPQGARAAAGDPAWMPRRTAWRNFAYAVAVRYGGAHDPDAAGPLAPLPRATALEIRPEPNRIEALRPQRLAGRLVAPGLLRLLVADAQGEARKAASPQGPPTIVSGGDVRAEAPTTPPAVFLRALGRTRAAPDAIGVRLEERGAPAPPVAVGDLALADLAGVLAAIDAGGRGADRRVWITGYGAPAGPAALGASEATQADAVVQLLAAARHPRIDAAVWTVLAATAEAPDQGLRGVGTEGVLGAERESWRRWIALRAATP